MIFGATGGTAAGRAESVPFASQPAISTSADGVRAILAADIDGDGDLDSVAPSALSDSINWFENTVGDGSSWTTHTISLSAGGPRSLAAADVDGDGDLDVLAASFADDTISWHENTAGNGTAWSPHTISVTVDGAFTVIAGDVDGDGDLDVLSASVNDNSVGWFENTAGDGSAWSPHVISATTVEARSVAAGDVDGDGDLDVLSAASGSDLLAWHENTAGDGTTWSPHTISATAGGVRSVVAADVDGDGDLDAVSASFDDDRIAWHENTAGDGSAWSSQTISSSASGARCVFASDMDGDGDVDILGASFTSSTIAWYENTIGDGSTWATLTLSTTSAGAESVFAGDVDGDGDLDALSASFDDDTVAWYRNEGNHVSGIFRTEGVISLGANGPSSITAADVDGDGDEDVLSASVEDDTISWYENTAGDGTAWSPHPISISADGAQAVFAADVDGDGDLDAFSASTFDDTIAWHENTVGDGTAWTTHAITTAADGAFSVFAADVDGDGDVDVLSAASFANTVAWHENTAGDGTAWTLHTISAVATSTHSVFAADVDGDGDLDALAALGTDDAIAWYENTAGDGSSWSPHAIPFVADNANSVSAADMDGDGDVDALSASYLDNRVAWYENTAGDGTAWTRHNIFIDIGNVGANSVTTADVDGDGDMDALATFVQDDGFDMVSWHENTAGDGTAWTLHILSSLFDDQPSSAAVGDVDGDGDRDILAASFNSDTLSWFRNDGRQIFADGFERGDTSCWSTTVP